MSTTAPPFQEIRLTLGGPIAEIALARADTRNAMTSAMGEEIERAVALVNADPDVRALVIGGNGKSFSSGGDFAMLEERTHRTQAENRATMRRFYDSFLSVRDVRVPTIAMLHGAAMGAGLCLAMACDIRLAAAKTKLGANFVRVGLHPGMGATWLLPRLVGPAKAAELLLSGSTIEAEEAHRIGLVNQVHPPEFLEGSVRALAEQIAAAAPMAVGQTKATLHYALKGGLDAALDREATAQAIDFESADFKEAILAFREKRSPIFGAG